MGDEISGKDYSLNVPNESLLYRLFLKLYPLFDYILRSLSSLFNLKVLRVRDFMT